MPYVESPEKLGEILTSVGLEVEDIERFEQVKGSLSGVITGEVMECEKHPDADRLQLTRVNVGKEELLNIVCGAPNVAKGQKVLVATEGTILYPVSGEAMTIKKAKIRGQESRGMICAEDELGLGTSHDGILVLPEDTGIGIPAEEYFSLYSDYIFTIGLTPNRMDAQSHLGVAVDICAWLSHHTQTVVKVISPLKDDPIAIEFEPGDSSYPIEVEVADPALCPRYAGITISDISVAPSPGWLQNKLKSIGLKPLNNVVDITNYILHETGQPLHAFDADKIKNRKIFVETLPENTPFITLDEKERKLSKEDIMICDGAHSPMCMAGVFGGAESGVSSTTKNIFLESAVFDPLHIRKSIIRHDLRTEAAIRFEKGVDISKTVRVLTHAATLIKEITGGRLFSSVVDVYLKKAEKKTIRLTYNYLEKLSGKKYEPVAVRKILESLGFSKAGEDAESITMEVPLSKPDITLPADVVEEVLRIDGLDQIAIPEVVHLAPARQSNAEASNMAEKILNWLSSNGFSEIFTNSLTNEKYFDATTLEKSIRILNSLSEGLTVMRPDMMPGGLECVAYNINRQNKNLLLYEQGKTYNKSGDKYGEKEMLSVYSTGLVEEADWNSKDKKADLYFLKGIASAICKIASLPDFTFENTDDESFKIAVNIMTGKEILATCGEVCTSVLQQFSIKQPVFYLELDWEKLISFAVSRSLYYKPVSRYPAVNRDLSMILDKGLPYEQVENLVKSLHIQKLKEIKLFDVFESDKLGKDKKSLAMSFTFMADETTLTDKEIDKMMKNIIRALETGAGAEIRSHA